MSWKVLQHAAVNRMVLAMAVALGTVAAGPSSRVEAAEESARVVNVSMEDQFRTRRATSQMKGDVVVLVYAERHGAEASRDLGRQLHVHFHPNAEKVPLQESAAQPVTVPAGWPEGRDAPDVKVVAVACLAEVPRPFHGLARSRFRSDSPHLPVWLDFTDTMKKTFGLTGGVPNVVILDTEGRVHAVESGRFENTKFDQLASSIDKLRLASATPVLTAAAPTSATTK
jgi:hypothetical protein